MYIDKKNNKGFTLIELLVVVAIIGLLSTLSIVALNTARAKARDARRVSDIKNIQTALEMYANENGYYPKFLSLTNCSVDDNNVLGVLKTDGLMSTVPKDPKYANNVNGAYYCYNYIGLGDATDYASQSSLYCNGIPRTNYQWTLLFSTESTSFNDFSKANSGYDYCIHGNLK